MTRAPVIASILALLLPVAARAADHAHHGMHEPAPPREAVCVLMPTQGNQASGVLVLTQFKGYVQITGSIKGLTPGAHGFHVHQYGDLRAPDGASAGAHFDPGGGHKHGGPESKERHIGDLGNVQADNEGVAKVNVKGEGLQLHFIVGRSLVVHAEEDDLKTQPSGNSGPRVGVGVIGIAEAPKPTIKTGAKR